MDADSWDRRKQRFTAKFKVGREHISSIFDGFDKLPDPEQVAIIAPAKGAETDRPIGGGKILNLRDLMKTIQTEVKSRRLENAAIPEQFVVLRTLQFAAHLWDA